MTQKLVFIHCGASKTGTSAQQAWLKRNSEQLQTAGIAYLGDILRGGSACFDFANSLVRSPLARSIPDHFIIHRHKGFFKQHRDEDVMLSSETFANMRALDGMKHVARFFNRQKRPVRTCLFVRNQVDQLSSHYAQRAQSLRVTDNFTASLDRNRLLQVDWVRHVQIHLSVGFDLKLGVFKGRNGPPVAETLMTAFGVKHRLPDDLVFDMEEANPSVGEVTVFASMVFAKSLIDAGIALGKRHQDEMNRYFQEGARLIPEAKFIGPSQSDRETIRTRFAEPNRQMKPFLSDEDYEELITERLPADRPASPSRWAELSIQQREMFDTVVDHVQRRIRETPRHAVLVPEGLLTQKLRPN
ncbi:MAG: hypothetical protein ABI459_10030 [Deltaproteobacteria bacterium]